MRWHPTAAERAMFTDFFYLLHANGLQVSLNEWLTLIEALHQGLHNSELTDFYYLARCILVKSEADYDRFDMAFAAYFGDIETVKELPKEFLEWLAKAIPPREFNQAEVDARFGGGLDLEQLRKSLTGCSGWKTGFRNRRSATTAAATGSARGEPLPSGTAAIILPVSASADPDSAERPSRWRKSGTTRISVRTRRWNCVSSRWRSASCGT